MDQHGYELLRQLGAGADGISYLARDPREARLVELRLLKSARADELGWPLLVRRLRLALHHGDPAAISVLHLNLESDPPFQVVEYVDAPSLFAVREGQTPLTAPDAINLAQQMVHALVTAHRLGLAHGQLAPSRIQYTTDHRLKIDLSGLDVHGRIHVAGMNAVDRSCFAPEAALHPAAMPEMDIYSLGALVFWLVTGKAYAGALDGMTRQARGSGSSLPPNRHNR
jgi:serine/threonine protein kinase